MLLATVFKKRKLEVKELNICWTIQRKRGRRLHMSLLCDECTFRNGLWEDADCPDVCDAIAVVGRNVPYLFRVST